MGKTDSSEDNARNQTSSIMGKTDSSEDYACNQTSFIMGKTRIIMSSQSSLRTARYSVDSSAAKRKTLHICRLRRHLNNQSHDRRLLCFVLRTGT
ncbi:hypothetical protein NPIL_151321, partial [Nephila pilipes]